MVFILISEIISIINNDLLFFIIFQLMIFNTITDIINKDVYIVPNLLFILLGFTLNRPIKEVIVSISIFPTMLFILSKLTNGIGLGDVILVFLLGFIFDIKRLVSTILLASIINLIYALFIKKDEYSFVPFIFISILLVS